MKKYIRKRTLLPFSDPRRLEPKGSEVVEVMRQAGWSVTAVMRITGASRRTVFMWRGGASQIPYAPWRLMLIHAGLVEPTKEPSDERARDAV